MGLFPEYQHIDDERVLQKKELKIGIFGSFEPSRYSYLESLKRFLIEKKYEKAKVATDLPKRNYRDKKEKYEIALENSLSLVKDSDIKVFFIFFEKDTEHGINESVATEIMANIFNRKSGDEGVITIIEQGADKQIHANLKGLLSKGVKRNWRTVPLDPIENLHEEMIESICYNYIGKKYAKFG